MCRIDNTRMEGFFLSKLESDNITKFVGHLCIGYFVFTCSLDRTLFSLLSKYHFYSQYFI